MDNDKWAVLVEPEGKVHVVEMTEGVKKVKGLGVFDAVEAIAGMPYGSIITIGQKQLRRMPPRLPELSKGMIRRAQTISAKDAGFFVSMLGIGSGDTILEAGLGSAGLSMHIARALGGSGLHVTVEPRTEHADVGLKNMSRAKQSWPEFPKHYHVEGAIEDVIRRGNALSPMTREPLSLDALIPNRNLRNRIEAYEGEVLDFAAKAAEHCVARVVADPVADAGESSAAAGGEQGRGRKRAASSSSAEGGGQAGSNVVVEGGRSTRRQRR